MKKRFSLRAVSVLLTLILLVSAFPIASVSASAVTADFDVPGISLSEFTGDADSGVTGEDSFRVSTTGSLDTENFAYAGGMGVATMTIDAVSGVDRVLSFDYYPSLSAPVGTVMIGDESVVASKRFVEFIPSGVAYSLTITVTSADGPNTTFVDIENILLEESRYDENSSLYVKSPAVSDYSVLIMGLSDDLDWDNWSFDSPDGYNIDCISGLTIGQSYVDVYVYYDSSVCQFVALVDEDTGEVLATASDYDPYTSMPEDNQFYYTVVPTYGGETVSPVFVPASLASDAANANFKVGDYYCADLDTAIQYARYGEKKVIEVNKTGLILNDSYTIPRGVTLMVPFDDAHTLYTTAPGYTLNVAATTSTANNYCLLQLGSSAHITIENGGAISVCAKHPAADDKYNVNGAVSGRYGQLDMAEGSSITVEGGGALYAWGFVTGDGTIDVLDGACVYEYFQVNDFRGGSETLAMKNDNSNQFFFNQYYVQNIEALLRIHRGGNERVFINLNASGQGNFVIVTFIGDGGAFQLDSDDSIISKKYDPEYDVMNYDMYGDASLHSISMELLGQQISSTSFYLPINDIVVNIHEGAVVTMAERVLFLPGSGVNVEEGATISISGDGSVIFADPENDAIRHYGYDPVTDSGRLTVPFSPATFSPTRTGQRTWSDTTSAFLVNDGTVIVTDSASLTSTSDSGSASGEDNISGSGTFVFESDAPAPQLTYCHGYGNSYSINNDEETEPIALTNDDDSAIDTSVRWSTPATFSKVNGKWGDYRTVSLYQEDKETLIKTSGSDKLSFDQFNAEAGGFLADVDEPTKAAGYAYHYTFDQWAVDSENTTTSHVSLYPTFTEEPNPFTVRWYTEDESEYVETVALYGQKPTGSPNYTKDPDESYTYTLKWKDMETGIEYANVGTMPDVSGDTNYKATYSSSPRRYTVYVKCYEGTGATTISNYPYGRSRAVSVSADRPKPTGGTFYGWLNGTTGALTAGTNITVTGNHTYYAVYTVPVTWYDSDGTTELCATTAYTCDAPAPDASHLTLPDKDGSKFIGWTNDDGAHVYDSASIPSLFLTPITSAVSYKAVYENNIDGKTLTLDGLIGENVYFNESAGVSDPSLSFTVTETGVEKPGVYNAESHRATVSLAPAELTYDVRAQYSVGGGTRYFTTHGYDYAASLFSGSAAAEAPEDGHYYLVGTINGNNCWQNNIQTRYEFKQNPSNTSEYMLEHVLLYAGDQFKAIKYNYDGNHNDYWYGSENQTIGSTGVYTIYFRPAGNSSWTSYYFYVQKLAVSDSYTQDDMDRDEAKPVTSALMNYATKAQLHFGRNVGDLANDHVNGNVYSYLDEETDDRIKAYDEAHPNTVADLKTGDNADRLAANYGLQYYGSNLILNAGITMRHYFLVTNASLVPNTVTFIHGENAYTATKVQVSAYYVYYQYVKDGSGIPGAEIGDEVMIKFTGAGKPEIRANYNVFNYAVKALAEAEANPTDTAKQTLAALIRSMYWYYIEANTYFNLVQS